MMIHNDEKNKSLKKNLEDKKTIFNKKLVKVQDKKRRNRDFEKIQQWVYS